MDKKVKLHITGACNKFCVNEPSGIQASILPLFFTETPVKPEFAKFSKKGKKEGIYLQNVTGPLTYSLSSLLCLIASNISLTVF
jgi:hypothetical protein